jgi:uncharacterized protein (DUF2141 family)
LYNSKPYYLTKTEKNGNFFLNNLAPGNYQIYAIKDANRNYIYDQDDEEVAFLDSLVTPYHISNYKADTNADGKIIKKKLPDDIGLFVFRPEAKETKFIDYKEFPPNKVLFVFNRTVENFKITPLDFESDTLWHKETYGKKRDSITTFFMGLKKDTINICLSDGDQKLDTLELILKKKKKKKYISTREKKRLEKERLEREKDKDYKPKPKAVPKIYVKTNISSNFAFFGDIQLRFKVPLNRYVKNKIHIYKKVDTLLIPLKVESWISDTINNMRITIRAKFDERQKYELLIQDSCLFDIYHSTNDTIQKTYTTTEMREYGRFELEVKYDEEYPLIIQLLNSKNAVLKETFITTSQKIIYPYLKAGKYKIKAIQDKNNNKIWDIGDLDKRIQPERVYFIKKAIEIRANWDTEHIWTIKD